MFAQHSIEPEVIFEAIAHVVLVIVLVVGGAGCLGFCLGAGLTAVSAYIIYRIAYKSSKHPPPASDNDENPKE
jgi:hypothetical protein